MIETVIIGVELPKLSTKECGKESESKMKKTGCKNSRSKPSYAEKWKLKLKRRKKDWRRKKKGLNMKN